MPPTASDVRLAVWGDPIDHSRSPQLHRAAYDVLGLDWEYGRRRVDEDEFSGAVAGLDASWRGLSLTMPLKGVAWRGAATRDRHAELTGAVNTYLFAADGPRGFNTDVGGLVRDLRERGFDGIDYARIVGAGKTATSALVALAELGVAEVEVVLRRFSAVAPLQALGDELGVSVMPVPFFTDALAAAPLTVAALPGGVRISEDAAAMLAACGGALYDVVYGHWPSSLALAWERVGAPAWDGLGMLLQQAVLQVRVFSAGSADEPLDDEPAVIAAMHAALAAGDAAAMGD
ncbi:MAG: shikimate dehydrogenase [Microbacterium sp.]|uniref:shikimate dehydrogenase family protein n=1 Tax=Microbacterium sp. TaxID=51671 RepID=UPI0039E6A778